MSTKDKAEEKKSSKLSTTPKNSNKQLKNSKAITSSQKDNEEQQKSNSSPNDKTRGKGRPGKDDSSRRKESAFNFWICGLWAGIWPVVFNHYSVVFYLSNDQASNCLNSLLKRYESMSENSQFSSGSKEDPLNNDIS